MNHKRAGGWIRLKRWSSFSRSDRGAADLIGDQADIGSIQPGRYADIIATRGDPLADIDQLQHVDFVMKGGNVVKAATP